MRKRPDKTDMGSIEKGFHFLGYHFSPQGLSLAEKTVQNFLEKARLIHGGDSGPSVKEGLSDYVKTWLRWANSGLSSPREKQGRLPGITRRHGFVTSLNTLQQLSRKRSEPFTN